ncbi:MAG: peptide chain release factor N(5)-glutamine methyltransferase, partial [Deltaproteobacteria bacterium]|nr:peptide chain release factor N(5)-glutamine methyltransferase [Deltaproteobacteria bacterium]
MGPKTWTIGNLLKVTTDYFKGKGIENPRLDAEVLLAHQLKSERLALYLNLDQPLTKEEISGYRTSVKRRVQREPLQYITGVQEFWSLEFAVGPQALIPRPESEMLVELAMGLLKVTGQERDHVPAIVDVGTGCGALAVSLACEMAHAKVWATDISLAALELARQNALKHRVADRVSFLEGDLLKPLENLEQRFDVILSNPPYVASEEYEALPPEVRDYEPRLALDGRRGGMCYVERMIKEAPDYLFPGGWLLIEMAPHQTEESLRLV